MPEPGVGGVELCCSRLTAGSTGGFTSAGWSWRCTVVGGGCVWACWGTVVKEMIEGPVGIRVPSGCDCAGTGCGGCGGAGIRLSWFSWALFICISGIGARTGLGRMETFWVVGVAGTAVAPCGVKVPWKFQKKFKKIFKKNFQKNEKWKIKFFKNKNWNLKKNFYVKKRKFF